MGIDENEFTDSSTSEKAKVILAEASSLSLESAYGSVKSSGNTEDWAEVSRVAKYEKAEKTVRELREQLKS